MLGDAARYKVSGALQAEWQLRPATERGILTRVEVLQADGKPDGLVKAGAAAASASLDTEAQNVDEHEGGHGQTHDELGAISPRAAAASARAEPQFALACVCNGACGHLYAPLQLHLPRRKRMQLHLLALEAEVAETTFNTAFAAAAAAKRGACDRIAELLERVKAIQADLGAAEMPRALAEAPEEDVEWHLRVEDSEVDAPRWLSESARCAPQTTSVVRSI